MGWCSRMASLAFAAACFVAPAFAQGARPPAVVTTAQSETARLPFVVEAIGSVQPIASVQIRTRVDAQIESIAVPDGASVKAGEILVRLDSRQIEAQLRQAQAQLDRDKATLEQNERDVARYAQLVVSKSATQVSLDNARTAVLATRAAIAGDLAAIENLKVQLSYYTLRAPISGTVGAFSLKAGNMARAADNAATGVLATINQIAPIYVTFSIPQRFLSDLRVAMQKSGALVAARPQGAQRWIDGKVALIDNTIDPATGMLVARATFANEDQALWPGQLCDLKVTLRVDDNLVVVPREAVQVGQKGHFVFVVDSGKAVLRAVKVGREQDGRAVIADGLKPGETVVVGGANLLTDGAAISADKAADKPGAKAGAT